MSTRLPNRAPSGTVVQGHLEVVSTLPLDGPTQQAGTLAATGGSGTAADGNTAGVLAGHGPEDPNTAYY